MGDRQKVFKTIWEYIILTIASFIFAWAWEGFMIPNGMSAGGMMGLCTVIQYATGGLIQASYSYIAVNAVLILIAVLAMGIGFGFRTIYAILVSTVAMHLMGNMPVLQSIPGHFFFVNESLVIPMIAGALEALGIGMVLRYGGSTGGTDIIALMVNKYWPVNLSKVFLLSDIIIICLILFLPGKTFADMIYGVIEVTVFSAMIDFVAGGKKSYQLLVFSEKNDDIADYICDVMSRGVTVVHGQGWYTKQDHKILLIIIDQKEFLPLSKKIKDMDPNAFMSVAPTHNVYGEGFAEIKTGVHLKLRKKGSDSVEHSD